MNKKSILLVGDIAVVNPFFNALDGCGHLIEVAANYEEVVSVIDKNSFDFAFIYVNSNHSKTYQVLELIAQSEDTKIFVITDDFTGNTMSNITNHKIESVIFFPTKKEYIDELIQKYFNSTTEPDKEYENNEINSSESKHGKNEESNFETIISDVEDTNIREEPKDIDKYTETNSSEDNGLLENQIIFDFTDDNISSHNEDANINKNNACDEKGSINKISEPNDYTDEGIAIRPPRIRVNTPISDILSKKERQMRMENVPEIVVDSDTGVSDNSKKEKGFLSKVKKIFK